ncbi:hypothetical protein, partial [Alistipes finegoldii]|uniref:hypothetical protein n=1 Tax=Alistipes finegoldii TaxID=214856 RepID=UPI003AB344B6
MNKKKVRFVKSNKKSVTFAQNYLGNKKEPVSGPVRILGVGNGDPAYQATERPADADALNLHLTLLKLTTRYFKLT